MSRLLTSWDEIVAQAAPSIPQWNWIIKSQSKNTFVSAPTISRSMAVLGCPMERIKWFMPGAIVWNTAPRRIIRMYEEATGNV